MFGTVSLPTTKFKRLLLPGPPSAACALRQSGVAGLLHRSGFRVHADYPQTHASRLNRDGRLLDPIRVQISAPFVQDQFRRPTVAVGHKSDLRVKGLKKIFANALRKYLILMAIYLRE